MRTKSENSDLETGHSRDIKEKFFEEEVRDILGKFDFWEGMTIDEAVRRILKAERKYFKKPPEVSEADKTDEELRKEREEVKEMEMVANIENSILERKGLK